jgi:hypothetical protein
VYLDAGRADPSGRGIGAVGAVFFWALTHPEGGLLDVGDSPRPLIAGAMTALPLQAISADYGKRMTAFPLRPSSGRPR